MLQAHSIAATSPVASKPLGFLTKTAALRILQAQSIAAKVVEVIRVFNNAVQVTYRAIGRCSRFLSPKAFTKDFREFREEGAKQVTVKRYPVNSAQFECQSSGREQTHVVKLVGTDLVCGCEDFKWQLERLNRQEAKCKHSLAVERFLVTESLEKQVLKQDANKDSKDTCLHARAIPGLDAVWCPDCKRDFDCLTPKYEDLMNCIGLEQQAKRNLFEEF